MYCDSNNDRSMVIQPHCFVRMLDALQEVGSVGELRDRSVAGAFEELHESN